MNLSLPWCKYYECNFLFPISCSVIMKSKLCRSFLSLHWRHNERDGVSNHQPHDFLLNRLFRSRSNKTSKLRVTVLCAGNSPVTSEFSAQMTSNVENVSIWWRHHVFCISFILNVCNGSDICFHFYQLHYRSGLHFMNCNCFASMLDMKYSTGEKLWTKRGLVYTCIHGLYHYGHFDASASAWP